METTSETSQEVQMLGGESMYLQDKVQIDSQISTARAFPRNIKRAIDNSIAVVTMDKETAATCTYSVPRAGKVITGASVHLAKILAQFWGNLRVESRIVTIDARHVTSEAVCFDLENNLAIKTTTKKSIIGKTGFRYSEDMIAITGAAASSVALRNAVLSVIPRAIVDKVYASAMQVITGDISDAQKLIARRRQVVDALKDTYNVSEKEVLATVGKVSIDHITGDDLVVLIGIGSAIKDGEISVETAFKPQDKKSNPLAETKGDDIVVKTNEIGKDAKPDPVNADEKKKDPKTKKDGELPL